MAQAAATLGQAAIRKKGWAADAMMVVTGAVLVALAAQVVIKLPFTPVPITGQTFAVALVGAALGSRRGLAALALYLLIGLALPVYAGGAHGWSVIVGSSGGYLLGFVLAAAVIGNLAERGWDRKVATCAGAMVIGNAVIYLIGVPWLALALHSGLVKALQLGLYPFVIGDLIKVGLASAALPAAWKLVGHSKSS
jgi:biotin transport system substrate-specific component